jgi:hypothetical protein
MCSGGDAHSVAAMHLRTSRAALPAALLTSLLAAAPADAAKRTDWLYDVTVRAEMTEKWAFHEEAHSGDEIEPCDRYQDGEGSAKIQLRSRRPTRVMVLRAPGGAMPNLNVGTGEGVPLTGSYQRVGKDEERHAGPRCGAANPPFAQPVSGCGVKTVTADWNLVFRSRGTVAPSLLFDDLRPDCPSGPPRGLEWDGDIGPQIGEATTRAAASKFYGTKQFTVRGTRTFTGTVPAMNEPHFARHGRHEVRWDWETTYRLVSKKRGRRR